eukprot:GHVS01104665.1.p1 GENE.GHVS01104665.1~~GHVS01104665.1.p1  ORF type:complete len:157 (-),score=5.16 GHVS01104665.1:284-754(-)
MLSLLYCLLFLSFVGVTAAPTADRRSLQPVSVNNVWRYCDGFVPQLFKDVQVDISPNPPRAGKWMTVTVSANVLTSEVEDPIIQTKLWLNDIIPFYDTRAYCDSHSCPVEPGRFSTTIRFYIVPFISGYASGKAKVFQRGSKDALVCVKIGPVDIR